MHANVGCHAGNGERLDTRDTQNVLQVRGIKRAEPWLVDHGLARKRRELIDDRMSGLAADEEPPQGA